MMPQNFQNLYSNSVWRVIHDTLTGWQTIMIICTSTADDFPSVTMGANIFVYFKCNIFSIYRL